MVQHSSSRKKALLEQIQNGMTYALSTEADTDQTMSSSPMLVSIPFPKRGYASRKRTQRSDDRPSKKIRKLENENRKLQRKSEFLRKKISRSSKKKENSSTPNSKTNKLIRRTGINPRDASEIKNILCLPKLYLVRYGKPEKKNSKQSIRSVISGKILRKYMLIHYAARRTNTDRRKLSKGLSKVINPNKSKRGFEPNLYKAVINFYNRHDVLPHSTENATPKKVKQGKPCIQKRVLNDYLSNLHQKFVSEHTNMSCSFTSFTRMRPKNFVLAKFANRRTCPCTQHQSYALKLEMLRKYAGIPANPEAFVKYSYQKISSIMVNIKQQS